MEPAVKQPPSPKPDQESELARKRERLLQEIADDAHQEPERFAETSLVPEGGE